MVVRVVNARLGFVRLHSFVPAVFAGNAVSTVKLTGSVVRNTKHVVHTQTDKHRCAHTHTHAHTGKQARSHIGEQISSKG